MLLNLSSRGFSARGPTRGAPYLASQADKLNNRLATPWQIRKCNSADFKLADSCASCLSTQWFMWPCGFSHLFLKPCKMLGISSATMLSRYDVSLHSRSQLNAPSTVGSLQFVSSHGNPFRRENGHSGTASASGKNPSNCRMPPHPTLPSGGNTTRVSRQQAGVHTPAVRLR